MDSPQAVRKTHPFYGRHYNDVLSNSSNNSLYSSSLTSSNALISNRSSVYKPNIERQLHSLVVEDDDTQEDTAELLQQTFDQLDKEAQVQSSHNSYQQPIRPVSTLTTTGSYQSSTSEEDRHSNESAGIQEDDESDFSAFTYPFAEQPVITGRTSTGYYIPVPTSIRNYLDYPDASVLKAMNLPYPFRVKEPESQRMVRLDSGSSFMIINPQQKVQPSRRKGGSNSGSRASQQHPIKPSKRHSLALGQVDQILRKNSVVKTNTLLKPDELYYAEKQRRASRAVSILSDRTQDIISWMPDQHTEWQDWMHDSDTGATHKESLSPPIKFNDESIPPRLHIPWNDEPATEGLWADSQLHPLDSIKK